jgi:hypothetical protein
MRDKSQTANRRSALQDPNTDSLKGDHSTM